MTQHDHVLNKSKFLPSIQTKLLLVKVGDVASSRSSTDDDRYRLNEAHWRECQNLVLLFIITLFLPVQKWLFCDIPIYKSYEMLNIAKYDIIENNFKEILGSQTL